jgi:hypothetical protein
MPSVKVDAVNRVESNPQKLPEVKTQVLKPGGAKTEDQAKSETSPSLQTGVPLGKDQVTAVKPSPEKNTPILQTEPRKDLPEKTQPVKKETTVQNKPVSVPKLESLEAQLIHLRGLLEKGNLIEADRVSDTMIKFGPESRIFPLLGKVKFLLNKFAAAEQLWEKALQGNHMITLELRHLHDNEGDFCLGQLNFKKKMIMFNSSTRGDHSFALMSGNVQAITLGDDLKIAIMAKINNQKMIEKFLVVDKNKKQEKEKFLVDFLNKYVL